MNVVEKELKRAFAVETGPPVSLALGYLQLFSSDAPWRGRCNKG
jgi:hypothetical protein